MCEAYPFTVPEADEAVEADEAEQSKAENAEEDVAQNDVSAEDTPVVAATETPMASEQSESDPVEEAPSPAADVPQEKPARASNDPREVRRREREAALRSQGVKVPDTDNESQDKTDGSLSS